MMKSFFKKLAFVMALAMVVSLVAPAGDAFAATTGIAIQGTDTIVTEYTFEKADATFDFCFKGAPSDWKKTYEWTSSNEDVATVDKAGVVTAVAPGTAVITITAGADKSYVETVKITVKSEVEEMEPAQKTHNMVEVTFTKDHSFDVTGAEGENTVKVYRVFSTEEMAEMVDTNSFVFDEEGNGYQAYYLMSAFKKTDANSKVWNLTGYSAFVDGARYAVVYGPNETSSTIEGIKAFFTAYIGKVDHIKIFATDATVENDVEAAIPAELSTKLYNAKDIDLTGYYKNADETDYELLEDNDIDVSVSGNEVTFDEPGVAYIQGSYTYYDEDLEEDVTKKATTEVVGRPYSTYAVEKIYKWTVVDEDATPDWSKLNNKVIAGDAGQLYVIVVDNRGNYYSNYNMGATKVDGHAIGYIGGDEDTAFEQYGYQLVFDSLDPDSLLVDIDGAVETYKKTNSFAVVSYKRSDDEAAKLHEIGIMGIEVTEARKLDKVSYNKTTFNVLKETEAEDGTPRAYDLDKAFGTFDKLTVKLMTQYKDVEWTAKAEDYDPSIIDFNVTTSKDAFKGVAETIAQCLNDDREFPISYASVFYPTEDANGKPDATSVTFKIRESATGDSTTITIKLNMPKYEEDGETVFVDATRAVAEAGDIELYLNTTSTAKLFQVSKANQKVGYFRTGILENGDEDGRSYYVANDLSSNFAVKNGDPIKFVSTASGSAMEFVTDLKDGDYVLVVTDPQGRIFPTVGQGGNGKSFKEGSQLGIQATDTAYELVLAAKNADGEMEYAVTGTYRATVYKITKKVEGDTVTKYSVSRVASDSFSVDNTQKNVVFYHQEKTKDVEAITFDHTKSKEENIDDVIAAIDATMTFKINNKALEMDETGKAKYKSWLKKNNAEVECDVWIYDVDFKIQNDNKRVVINTVTFAIETPAEEGGYYLCKVKVNRSINAAD